MSSKVGGCSPEPDFTAPSAGAAVVWVWPGRSRGVLAALALLAASWLALAAPPVHPSSGEAAAPLPLLVLDLNTAPGPALAALPEVGPGLVARLVAARNDRPFGSVSDVGRRVRGVGSRTLAQLAPHLRMPHAGMAPVEIGARAPQPARATAKMGVARGTRPRPKVRSARSSPLRLASRASKSDTGHLIEIEHHE